MSAFVPADKRTIYPTRWHRAITCLSTKVRSSNTDGRCWQRDLFTQLAPENLGTDRRPLASKSWPQLLQRVTPSSWTPTRDDSLNLSTFVGSKERRGRTGKSHRKYRKVND